MKYKEFDILKKAKFSIITNSREVYVVNIKCDANDGDYMRDSLKFDKTSFEKDELLLLVLSYVSKRSGKFSEGERPYYSSYYGYYVMENLDFPWLFEYLSKNNILIFAGMCDYFCHSISSINIIYYDEEGVANKVELPDVDDLFENKEEFINYLNNLYSIYNNENTKII